MDTLSKEQRSKNMHNIKSKDTQIEKTLRSALWKRGLHYRKNYKKLTGSPDIAFTKYKIAVFCDGEFFHGKDWEELKARLEKSNNSEYWIRKIERNRIRDDEIDKKLSLQGWKVLRFWGKDIRHRTEDCVQAIEEAIFQAKLDAIDEYESKQDEF